MITFFGFIFIAFVTLVVIFLCLAFLTPFFSKVPFVPVRDAVVDEIVSKMDIRDGSVVYDLGAGDGRVLFACAKKYPKANFIGIERAPFPYLISKILKVFMPRKNLRLKYGNFYKTDLTQATHIFVYLFPKVLDELLPKFEKELKQGSIVYSCDFRFSKKEPIQVLDLKAKHYQLNRRLNIYKF